MTVFHHIFDFQALCANCLLFVDQTPRDFMQITASRIRDSLVRFCQHPAGFPMTAAFIRGTEKPACSVLVLLCRKDSPHFIGHS